MTAPKSLARLEEVLNAYGSDPRAWPAEERAALLAALPPAPGAELSGDAWSQAQALDSLLVAAKHDGRSPAASPALRARIAALPFALAQRAKSPAAASQPSSGTAGPRAASAWLRVLGLAPSGVWTPRAFAPTVAVLALVAMLGFAAGYRGMAIPLGGGAPPSGDLISLEDETLLPLSEDWS
jgi:hypothetical protein